MLFCTVLCQAQALAPVVSRFKAAEKKGEDKRAAAAAALAPWLSPGVLPAVKEATIRTLVAAGVAPSKPQPKQQQHLQPAPSPLKPARWSGCLQQQHMQEVQAVHAQFRDGQQPLQDSADMHGLWPKLTGSAASPNRKPGAKRTAERQQQPPPAQAVDTDIEALLAALEVDAAAAGSPVN